MLVCKVDKKMIDLYACSFCLFVFNLRKTLLHLICKECPIFVILGFHLFELFNEKLITLFGGG